MARASRQALNELRSRIDRLSRYGWRVEDMGGRGGALFQIICPDGFKIPVHGTPSDQNWLDHTVRKAKYHGLLADESKANEFEKLTRKLAIQADVERNNRKLERAQQEAEKREMYDSTLLRHAGDAVPQPLDIHWLMEKHEFPATKRVLISPELCEALLETTNTNNRPLRSYRVKYWEEIMKAGLWRYLHQGIAWDVNGVLQDGQHRLRAAANTGITLDINVSVGMPVENFPHIDTGYLRTAGDTLAIAGKVSVNHLAAAAKMVRAYDLYGVETRNRIRERVPNMIVLEHAEKYGEPLMDAIREASHYNTRRDGPSCPTSVLATAIYLIRRAVKNKELVDEFFRAYAEGTNVSSKNDPRFKLRNFMYMTRNQHNRRVDPADLVGIIIKAWNFWARGKEMHSLSFRRDELMPSIIVPIPGDVVNN